MTLADLLEAARCVLEEPVSIPTPIRARRYDLDEEPPAPASAFVWKTNQQTLYYIGPGYDGPGAAIGIVFAQPIADYQPDRLDPSHCTVWFGADFQPAYRHVWLRGGRLVANMGDDRAASKLDELEALKRAFAEEKRARPEPDTKTFELPGEFIKLREQQIRDAENRRYRPVPDEPVVIEEDAAIPAQRFKEILDRVRRGERPPGPPPPPAPSDAPKRMILVPTPGDVARFAPDVPKPGPSVLAGPPAPIEISPQEYQDILRRGRAAGQPDSLTIQQIIDNKRRR